MVDEKYTPIVNPVVPDFATKINTSVHGFITDENGEALEGALAVGNKKAGIEITAVANNTVYLHSSKQQIISIKVIAADGTVVVNQQQMIRTGSSTIALPMISSAKGMYTLIVYINNGEIITKRFIQ